MYPFVESLRIENGEIHHLSYHNERLNRTRREVYGCMDNLNLADYLTPVNYHSITKCRIEYQKEILKVEYQPYQLRTINSLQLVTCNEIDYHLKSADRTQLNELFTRRGNSDDILIIRNELITDSFSCNVALFNGKEWHTPTTPLLKGTARSFLLDTKAIKERTIPADELFSYEKITLFNAMINFRTIEIKITKNTIHNF